MPQLPESVVFASPRLVFSNPEHIVSGVVVNPVDFAQKQVAPLFKQPIFTCCLKVKLLWIIIRKKKFGLY